MNTFKKANILIPKNVDFTKWSVVACDQYTSEPEYWKRVEENVGDSYSTLNIIFPEVYLKEGDSRIEKINAAMKKYVDDDIFKEYENSLIYVERTVSNGKIRHGLVGCIDLEDYDFKKGSAANVRATEGTVLERIPPRVKIRENAPLELPHVMVLIDDAKKEIIEGLEEQKDNFEKIYDFDLMENGGHIKGFVVDDKALEKIFDGIEALETVFEEKYSKDMPKMIFAVGDGNHSLATAKTCWENIKTTLSEEERKTHPARFALCEIVNVHDDALEFEPIHRVVFDVDADKMINALKEYYETSENECDGQYFEYVTENTRKGIYVKNPKSGLAVGTLQMFIDDYIKENGGSVDYIHGEDVTVRLGSKSGNIGFILPAMKKSELFETVISDGALPRKTFSMGEAHEKRFYIECKKIR